MTERLNEWLCVRRAFYCQCQRKCTGLPLWHLMKCLLTHAFRNTVSFHLDCDRVAEYDKPRDLSLSILLATALNHYLLEN